MGPVGHLKKGKGGGGALYVTLQFYTIFHITRYLPYSILRLNMGGEHNKHGKEHNREWGGALV